MGSGMSRVSTAMFKTGRRSWNDRHMVGYGANTPPGRFQIFTASADNEVGACAFHRNDLVMYTKT